MTINSIKEKLKQIPRKSLLVHTLCWLFFITYELAFVYYHVGSLERPYIYIVFYSINLTLFYVYVRLLNFTFSGRKARYLIGFILFICIIAFYLILKGIADNILADPKPLQYNSNVFVEAFIPRNIARAFYFVLLGTFYWSAKHIAYFKRQALEAEKRQLLIEKKNAELDNQLTRSRNAYLQQQINPHMLFNALNFAYNSTQKYSDEAAQCIWLLSEIMRFSLEEADPDGKIRLEREVEQIENLIAINRYRFKEPLHLKLHIVGDLNSYKIIPLILLTLTENMFKHGDLTEADYPAFLKLTVDKNGKLTFHTKNLKKSKNGHPRDRKAVGLQNIRLRMDAFYKDSYQLEIDEAGDFYELTLTLQL